MESNPCSVVCVDCSPRPGGALVTVPGAGDHRCWRCGRTDAQMIYGWPGTTVVAFDVEVREPCPGCEEPWMPDHAHSCRRAPSGVDVRTGLPIAEGP